MYVSFTGLYSHIYVSFDPYTSLLIFIRLYTCQRPHSAVQNKRQAHIAVEADDTSACKTLLDICKKACRFLWQNSINIHTSPFISIRLLTCQRPHPAVKNKGQAHVGVEANVKSVAGIFGGEVCAVVTPRDE